LKLQSRLTAWQRYMRAAVKPTTVQIRGDARVVDVEAGSLAVTGSEGDAAPAESVLRAVTRSTLNSARQLSVMRSGGPPAGMTLTGMCGCWPEPREPADWEPVTTSPLAAGSRGCRGSRRPTM
jgi:hypothetical protein